MSVAVRCNSEYWDWFWGGNHSGAEIHQNGSSSSWCGVICTTTTNIAWKWWFFCTASANQTKRTYLESQPFMPTECMFGNCGHSCFTPSFFSQEHRSTFGFEPIREKIGRFKPPNHHHHHHWQIWLEATFIGFPYPWMATGETGRDIFMCCCVGLMVLLAMARLSDPAPHTSSQSGGSWLEKWLCSPPMNLKGSSIST